MDHLAFYNAGCEPTPGHSGLKIWVRRQARKILLPPSQRLVEILVSLCRRLDGAEHELNRLSAQVDDLRRRQEDQAAKTSSTIAFGWDYVAMVRRLAVLEEHVDTLLSRDTADSTRAGLEVDRPSRSKLG